MPHCPRIGLISVAALLLACIGCAGPPPPVQTFDFISDYARMTDEYDPALSLVYLPEPAKLTRYRRIVVADFTVGEHVEQDRESADAYALLFRILVKMAMTKSGAFEDVTLDVPVDVEQPACRIEGMITRFKRGSGWSRYFGGLLFLGTGATDLQIEGRLVDCATGAVIMEFADRRRHLGNTPWGPNPRNLKDSDFAMNVTAKLTAEGLAIFLQDICEPLAIAGATVGADSNIAVRVSE
jgi:hypothetical protein